MDINYGDKMDYPVSISSNDFTMANKMQEMSAIDRYYEPYTGLKGPQHRFDLISGNKGIYRAEPDRIAINSEEWLPEQE